MLTHLMLDGEMFLVFTWLNISNGFYKIVRVTRGSNLFRLNCSNQQDIRIVAVGVFLWLCKRFKHIV